MAAQDQAGGQPRCSRLVPGRRTQAAAADIHNADQERGEHRRRQDYFEERYRERVLGALLHRAAKLGMQMIPIAQQA